MHIDNHSPLGRADAGSVPQLLRLARTAERCEVLGPGARFVIWVQGCHLACPGCVSVDTHPFEGGEVVEVAPLARRIAAEAMDGLTISGGEPMLQAAALVDLVTLLGRDRPELTVMCYSGYTLEHLREHGTAAQRRLVDCVDCLIDGRFMEERQSNPPLRWRGSANQRVHLLSPRVQHWAQWVNERGVWLEVETGSEGVFWRGIQPPGFNEAFVEAARRRGVNLGFKPPSASVSGPRPAGGAGGGD
jgi:anaerobic ribonucleoside-triphosphate reductase activating protein